MIPKQLQNKDYRFCILGKANSKKCKIPIEKKWNTINNYGYNSPKLLQHIKSGHNYAIITHYGELLVIDFDAEWYQKALMHMMPNTFTVKSGGKGLYHLYYKIDKPFRKFSIKSKGKTIADFLCLKSATVAPGSIHESGRAYEIINNSKIAPITQDFLKYILGKNFPERIVQVSNYKRTTNKLPDMMREVISPSMVLQVLGVDTARNPCECPFHSSSGGSNLAYNNDHGVMHCFNCGFSGNIFHLWMKKYNMGFRDSVIQLYTVFNAYTKHLNTSYAQFMIQ